MTDKVQNHIHWPRFMFPAVALVLWTLGVEGVDAQTRKFIDPGSEYGRLVGIVTQLDGSGGVGNGFVIGADGCHVLTNVHTTYGIGKDVRGNAILVDDLSMGRTVRFHVDFDANTKSFRRILNATVIHTGNFTADTRRGRTQDIAILVLDKCLGPVYGTLMFDHEAVRKRFPESDLVTIGFGAIGGEAGIVMEKCSALQSTPTTGLFISNCYTEPGSSGMMYLEKRKADGKLRLVGVHQGREHLTDGTSVVNVPVAVYARAFNPIIDQALGEKSPLRNSASNHTGR